MKFVKLRIQKYSSKYKLTIEIDTSNDIKDRGLYKLFKAYLKAKTDLENNNLLINHSSLEYNKTQIIQIQIKKLDAIYDFIKFASALEYCEIVFD